MSKSKFVKGKKLTVPEKLFEKWLTNKGYFAITDFYPAGVNAESLVDEFCEENPAVSYDAVRRHAGNIGWVSDYTDDDWDDNKDLT